MKLSCLSISKVKSNEIDDTKSVKSGVSFTSISQNTNNPIRSMGGMNIIKFGKKRK